MVRGVRFLTGMCLVLSIPAMVTTAAAAEKARVTGTATYRERIALPPGAVFEAALEDVSRSDRPGVVLARTRKHQLEKVPVSFSIPYDPRQIHRRAKYVVRARIFDGGHLRFSGAEPVLTPGQGSNVRVLMRQVYGGGAERPRPKGGAEARLTDSRWVPVRVDDRDVTVSNREREAWMELDSHTQRVTGSGGCNRFSGPFEQRRGTLSMGPLVATKMACLSMDAESAFFRALERTRQFRIQGRTLDLMDDMGKLVARLEERNLR